MFRHWTSSYESSGCFRRATSVSEPYLIAHLVRGIPSFDIATREDIAVNEAGGEEAFWIIPTSGHRAYPWWSMELALVYGHGNMEYRLEDAPDFASWPDHYSTSAAPKGQGLVRDLAERLGLVKRPTVSRR